MPNTTDNIQLAPVTELPQRLMTPDQLAEILGVPKKTVYAWSSAGNYGPTPVRIGRHLRYEVADVTSWIEGSKKSVVA